MTTSVAKERASEVAAARSRYVATLGQWRGLSAGIVDGGGPQAWERSFGAATLLDEEATGDVDGLGRFEESRIAWDTVIPRAESALGATGLGPEGRARHGFGVIMTHDVDRTTAWEPLSVAKALARTLGLCRSEWLRLRQAFSPGLLARNIQRLLEFEQTRGIGACYFMMAGPAGLGRYSTRTDIRWKSARTIARLITQAGMSIGLHGSFAARERNSYAAERVRLEESLDQKVRWHRNHYLRFDARKLASQMEAAGLEADFSFGFVGRMGFRNGTAGPVPLYDFTRERTSKVLAVPMLLMDTVLAHDHPENLLSRFRKQLEEVRQRGGCVSLNFHPETLLIAKHAWQFFTEVVTVCKEMGADLSGGLGSLGGLRSAAEDADNGDSRGARGPEQRENS